MGTDGLDWALTVRTVLACAKDPPQGVVDWGDAAAAWHNKKCQDCGAGHAQYAPPPSPGGVPPVGQWCGTCVKNHPGSVIVREKEIEGSGGSPDPPGRLLTRLHNARM